MKKNSAKKNYIYSLLHQFTLLLLPLIVTPYISRVLLPEGVGQYSFTYSIITYFTIFASLGFGYYAQREIAKYQGDKYLQSKTFWEINIVRLIPVGIATIINIILILLGVYGDNTLLMSLLTINILAVGIDISFLFQGNENFSSLLSRNIFIRIIFTMSIFVFIKDQSDLWVYCLLQSLSLFASNLLLWPSIGKTIELVPINKLTPLKHLPGAIMLFIPNIATSIYTVLDKSLIGLITQSNAENGYYEQAEKIAKMSMTVITCLSSVMIPRNTNEYEKGNIDGVKNNIYTACHFCWLLGIPMCFGMISVASNLVPWFLGVEFEPSIFLLQIFSFLILIIGLSSILGVQYMLPSKKDKKFGICLTIGAVVNLILNLILIHFLKSIGAAIATIIAESVVTIMMLIMTKKELSIKNIFKSMLKPFIAGILMFIVTMIMGQNMTSSIFNTFIIVGAGLLIYGIMIIILKDSLIMAIIDKLKRKICKN